MKNLKDYFTFTKKERTGIIVLLVLILATVAIPYLLPTQSIQADKASFEELRQQVAALEAMKDSGNGEVYQAIPTGGMEDKRESGVGEVVALFEFDPNTLPVEGWKKLGLPARTANTIQHYLSKGGRFRQPDDLYKIYGLKKAEADRLFPYVRIAEAGRKYFPTQQRADSATRQYKREFTKPSILDINMADTTAFIALWGIGSKLAQRIINFREKLGGFYTIEQVGETYGLSDSTFEQIRAFLNCPSPQLRMININTADPSSLAKHPYIRWPLANAIIQFREQHGVFSTVDQLLQLQVVTPEILGKIRPYLAVQ
jgi:competence ComEA-like helix-hairpin-helix protein